MAGKQTISLEIERAYSALTILRTLLHDTLHDDDATKFYELIGKAEDALDKASGAIGHARSRIQDQVDQL